MAKIATDPAARTAALQTAATGLQKAEKTAGKISAAGTGRAAAALARRKERKKLRRAQGGR